MPGDRFQLKPMRIARRAVNFRSCVALGGAEGERYTMRQPRNLFPAAANQMGFDQRELNIIGHWSRTPRIPGRYDRSVCANSLLLRNTIITKIRKGGEATPAFHIPATATDYQRIGEDERPGSIHAANDQLGARTCPTTRRRRSRYRRLARLIRN